MYTKKVKALIVVVLILVLWQVVCSLKLYSTFLLPTPQMVLTSFLTMLKDGTLFKNTVISLKRVFLGYTIAFVLAFLLALVSYRFPKVMEYFDFVMQFMRNVPPLALVPLLILYFGIKEKSKLIVIVLACFFPMYLAIEKGFKSVDSKLIEVGKTFNFTNLEIFKKIVLPAACPDILVGCRIGMGYSYRAIIGAEMIASSAGLGYMINFAKSLSNTDEVLVGIIVIGVLGYLCDWLFKVIINHYFKEVQGHGFN